MQDFAEKFYKSKQWQRCRANYYKKAGGLCEACLQKGYIVPGEIVHHKIVLNASNINDLNVTMNFDNLELLCRKCHGEEHGKNIKRYTVDELGRVVAI